MITISRYVHKQVCIAAVIAAALICTSTPAWAQQDDSSVAKVEALSAEGAELFRNGNFQQAIERFKQAYELVPVANLLYNIALSYERLENQDLAIQYYELFIVADDADPSVRATSLKRMQELDRQRRANSVDPMPEDPDEPVETATQPAENNSNAWTTAGIISAGLGVTMAGTGVVFALMADSEQNTFDESVTLNNKTRARDAAESNALTADILFGGGAVAVIAGIVFILIDSQDDGAAPTTTLRFTPITRPDNVGASVTVSF